jgi:hypothetical protein
MVLTKRKKSLSDTDLALGDKTTTSCEHKILHQLEVTEELAQEVKALKKNRPQVRLGYVFASLRVLGWNVLSLM